MLDLMCFLMKAEETKKQLGVLNNAVLHNNNKYMQAYIQKCTFSPKRSRESSKKIFNSCLAFLFAIKGIMIHKLMTIFFALFLFFFNNIFCNNRARPVIRTGLYGPSSFPSLSTLHRTTRTLPNFTVFLYRFPGVRRGWGRLAAAEQRCLCCAPRPAGHSAQLGLFG